MSMVPHRKEEWRPDEKNGLSPEARRKAGWRPGIKNNNKKHGRPSVVPSGRTNFSLESSQARLAKKEKENGRLSGPHISTITRDT